ncbi:hypothetical protein [Pseudomonas sp. S2_B07]
MVDDIGNDAVVDAVVDAADVSYIYPDGVVRTVQDLSNKSNDLLGLKGLGYRSRDAWIALNYLGVSPLDFGAPGYGNTDATAAVNLAVAEAKSKRIPLNIDAFFLVSAPVVIEDANGLVIKGSGIIRTSSDTAQYVLDIKNCTGVTASGNITIDGNSKVNIIAAIRVAAIGSAGGVMKTCSLHHLKLDAINASIGWQIGDFSAPDNLISEMKLSGTTYNTPVGMLVIGSQAVINISGMDLVAAGQGIFATYAHSLVINHGGIVILGDSEAQMPAVSNGLAFVSCPIDSPAFANSYGAFTLQSCPVETPSILFLAYNPRAVPNPEPGTGGIIMNGCRGYHNCSVESFQGAVDFSGSVLIGDNGFFRTTPKTTRNSSFSGPAKVRISDSAFDDHFLKGLGGILGGIALFDYQKIFEASYILGATMASGANTFLYQAVPATYENSHFYANYNLANGVFTVPVGGLKSVRIQLNFINSQPNAGSALQVTVNGLIRASASANSTYSSGSFELGDLAAGDMISAQFLNAGSAFAATGAAQNQMVICARR